MTECATCGWFIEYVAPKEPAKPGWEHLAYRQERPAADAEPCGQAHPDAEVARA